MRPVKERWGIEETAVRCILAGHDMAMHDYESDPFITYQALLEACREGRIPLTELDTKVRRILALKERAGVHDDHGRYEAIRDRMDEGRNAELAQQMADAAVTVFAGPAAPLAGESSLLAVTCYRNPPGTQQDLSTMSSPARCIVEEEIRGRVPDSEILHLGERPEPDGVARAVAAACGRRLAAVFHLSRHVAYESGSGQDGEGLRELVHALTGAGASVTCVNLGNPVHSLPLDAAASIILTYCDGPESIRAGIRAAFGELPARGTLPLRLERT
jgi:beta-N-acetylhexosaminidase